MLTRDMHLHSSFSDGLNTPEEMIVEAIRIGYKEIAITDHVRRASDWLDNFSTEISRLKSQYADVIKVYSGIEAKVIDLDGNIDAHPEFFNKVDLVLGAFHRIPIAKEEYLRGNEISQNKKTALDCWFKVMIKLIENSNVAIVAHPTAILKRNGIDVPYDFKEAIAQKAAEFDKILEINLRYQIPDKEFIRILQRYGVRLITGTDSHSIEEMRASSCINEWWQ